MNNLDAYAMLGRAIGDKIRGQSTADYMNELAIKKQAKLQESVERAAMDRLMKEIDARAANQRDALKAERELLDAKLKSSEYSQLMNQAHEGDLQNKSLQARINMNLDDNINRDEHAQLLYELSQRALLEGPGNAAKGEKAAADIPGSKAAQDKAEREAALGLLPQKTAVQKQTYGVLLKPENADLYAAHVLNVPVREDQALFTPGLNFFGASQSRDSKGLTTFRPPQVLRNYTREELEKIAAQKALDETYNKAANDVNAKKKKTLTPKVDSERWLDNSAF